MKCTNCVDGIPTFTTEAGVFHAVPILGTAREDHVACEDPENNPSGQARAWMLEHATEREALNAAGEALVATMAGEPLEPHPVEFVPEVGDPAGQRAYGCPKCEKPLASLEEAETHAAGACDPTWKSTNPKDSIGATKIPLHLVPTTAIALAALAHHNGRGKYGAWNWRIAGVRASIYLDALFRHVSRWIHGEEVDPEDGVPNLGGALACLNIIIDARACGKLVDDRPPSFDVAKFFADLTPLVAALNAKHAERHPRHYTIADTCAGCGQDENAQAKIEILAAKLDSEEQARRAIGRERDEARDEYLGASRKLEAVGRLVCDLRKAADEANVPSVGATIRLVADGIDEIINPKPKTKGEPHGAF